MDIRKIVEELSLEVKTTAENTGAIVKGCYVSDLLSNVMGQTGEGVLWVTMQGHPNIVAIAALLSLSGIIVTGSAAIDAETIKKADENGVAIMTTSLSSFEVAGRLYQLGIKSAVK